jgi:hypothetical protein
MQGHLLLAGEEEVEVDEEEAVEEEVEVAPHLVDRTSRNRITAMFPLTMLR